MEQYENLKDAISKSHTYTEVMERLGYKCRGGGAFRALKAKISKLEISTAHFKTKASGVSRSEKWKLEDILVENSKYANLSSLKRRLVNAGLLSYECERCGLSEWMGQKLSLHLDHKNGINNDHRIFNLRLLCPNCHSQTDTYSGKNNKVNAPNLCACGKEISRLSKHCKSCMENAGAERKVENRPTLERLLEEVEEMGYSNVGKSYGVSDNAIRKWIIGYGGVPPKTMYKNGGKRNRENLKLVM